MVAPFWADIDTRGAGSVFYEVHEWGYNRGSNAMLERLSGFISSQKSVNFTASWMLVAQWDRVHPFPHGIVEGDFSEQYRNFLDRVSYRFFLRSSYFCLTQVSATNRKTHFKPL